MNKTTQILLIILTLSFTQKSLSQITGKTDSLELAFEQSNNDSLRNKALKDLYNEYLKDNRGMAINTAKNGIEIFKETNTEEAFFWYNKLGSIYLEQGFYTLALNTFSDALKLSENDNSKTAYTLLNIAKIYYYKENYEKSIEIYKNALAEFKILKEKNSNDASIGIAKTYNKLAIVYESEGDLKTSKEYFIKALNLRLKIDSKKDIADSYTSLGYFSNVIQKYDSALYYFSKGTEICKTYNNYDYFVDLHLFRSKTFNSLNQTEKAYNDIDTAFQYALKNNKFDLAKIYYYRALADTSNKKYPAFLKDINKSIQYTDSFNILSLKNKALKLAVTESVKQNDYTKAFQFQQSYTQNIQTNEAEKLIQLEQNIDLETQKQKNIELIKDKKGLEKNLTLYQMGIATGILLILFLILSFYFNSKKNKRIKETLKLAEERKTEAEKAKKELEDSTELIRSQAALAEILRNVTGKERSIEDFLQDALNKLLALPWLDVVSKGSVFLTTDDGNLKMVAEKDLGEVAVRCALIKPGECLCGKALSEKRMQFCNHIDHNHEIRFQNMTEHGHYNLPIIMQDEVLGVLNLYTAHEHKKNDFEIKFLKIVCDTLASVINRKKAQDEIIHAKQEIEKHKAELEKKNKAIRLYSTQLEQKNREQEILNQTVLAQKRNVEKKQKETEDYAQKLEKQAKAQEALNQQLFSQKMEVEQQKAEVEEYAKQIEKQAKEQEALNQQLFAQKLEVEQRNTEVEEYSKILEEKAKEQEALNQQLFAQKLEVEQRNSEVELYLNQIEEQKKEQETLNQKLFAQKLEVEQRNFEVEQYSEQIEDKAKEQEALNQQLFAQKLEVEQRNFEVELYSKQLEEKAKEQEALNQQLFAQKLEVEQRNSEVEQYLKQIEDQKKEQDALNQKLFAQSLEVDQRRMEIEMYSKEIEELKEKAEGTLEHLNDSINYSKYIQTSLLPEFSYIKENLPGDFFIYFNPKETIGGDFYYFKRTGDWLIFAVADCTGHGIPGALITMLGMSFLDDIVTQNLTDSTGEGLNILRKRVKGTFHSYGNTLENKNGLDIALCAVNTKTNLMQYSGAFNSLFIFRDKELIEYKATRNPIGYYPIEKDFETTEIQLQEDDVIYLFSDGYADQIGGEKNRKFSKRQFKSLLEEIHHYPMSKQEIFMEKIMQKWMGNNTQVDDITVMGFKWEG